MTIHKGNICIGMTYWTHTFLVKIREEMGLITSHFLLKLHTNVVDLFLLLLHSKAVLFSSYKNAQKIKSFST
jgi:hypothetical protein